MILKTDIVILAAGQGSRMQSTIPKVLHPIGGKPMLHHVIDSAKSFDDVVLNIVVGHGSEAVVDTLPDGCTAVTQADQLGTAHAVTQALPNLRDGSNTLILYGDVPLIKTTTLEALAARVNEKSICILTANLSNPSGYGRIVRTNGSVKAIVEHKDASDEQRKINEINTGIMCVPAELLKRWLPKINNNNVQREFYLTDIIAMAASDNVAINTLQPDDLFEIEGVNDRKQLASLERKYQQHLADELMAAGVTIADPNRIDIRGSLKAGRDTFIDVNTVFIGDVVLGEGVSVGSNTFIKDAEVGSGTEIFSNTVIESACVGNTCKIGPFARLRPGTDLSAGVKVGNFVEVKNSTFEENSKANHLSYIGDSTIGSSTNIGAGTITCNYDGVNKLKTIIGDNVFIGSNSTLVAPLTIEDGGFVAAGSTVTQTVPKNNLAVGRGRQKNIVGWKRPMKNNK